MSKKNKEKKIRLNKKASILIGIIFILVLAGILVSIKILPNKLKGSVPIYKTYDVGDEFCLDTECFYTMSDNGDSVTALAKWNLNIGDNKNPSVPEGIQDESIKGYVSSGTRYGEIAFSSTNYWSGKVGEELDYPGSYSDPNYPFVFDDNSNLWQPVQNYKNYLRNTLGKTSVTTTLMGKEQVDALKISNNDILPSWIYNTSYWLGSAYSNNNIWFVYSYGNVANYIPCNIDGNFGVRPVITIAKSDFAEVIGYEQTEEDNGEENNNNNTNDNKTYKVGNEFCLDTECFYTISDNGDTVTALAKYNLYVGNIYNSETDETVEIPTTTEGYGLQNKNTLIDLNSNITVGAVQFILDENNECENSGGCRPYWANENNELKEKYGSEHPAWIFDENSNLWDFIQNYEYYLKSNGYSSINISIPNYKMFEQFNCEFNNSWHDGGTCSDEYPWIYSTSYWSGTELWGSDEVYGIHPGYGDSYFSYYSSYEYLGVRPVITIVKSDLNKKEEVSESKTEDKKTVVNTTTKKETVVTTKTSKKVVATTKTEEKKEETTTTTTVGSINKIVKKEEVKTSNPIVPIGLGIVGVSAIGSIFYFYLRKY